MKVKIEPEVVSKEYVFAPGNLVRSKLDGSIVIVDTRSEHESEFTGGYITHDNKERIGSYTAGFNMANFYLFRGKITLTQ